MPLVSVLTKMELVGVAVDVNVLREQSQLLGSDLQRIEADTRAHAQRNRPPPDKPH